MNGGTTLSVPGSRRPVRRAHSSKTTVQNGGTDATSASSPTGSDQRCDRQVSSVTTT